MHTLDSHLHRGVLHVLFEAMPFDSCTRARQAIKWQRHYMRRTKLDLTFSLGVGRKFVSGVVERGRGEGLLFQAPSLTLDKTRFMKITKCKVGKRSGCMTQWRLAPLCQVATAPVMVPRGRMSELPEWKTAPLTSDTNA